MRKPREPGMAPGPARRRGPQPQQYTRARDNPRHRPPQPLRPEPSLAALRAEAARLCRQQLKVQLHRLGERTTVEFVEQLVRWWSVVAADIDRHLADYATLDPHPPRQPDGDCSPPAPVWLVPR